MTNSTGSNNLAGLLGGLVDTIETVVGIAESKLSDFAQDAQERDDEPKITYKHVAELGLADALILDDGSWQVVALQGDGFDPDIISVTLENGESYDLIRSSLVRVV
jgi:hypothetical protein